MQVLSLCKFLHVFELQMKKKKNHNLSYAWRYFKLLTKMVKYSYMRWDIKISFERTLTWKITAVFFFLNTACSIYCLNRTSCVCSRRRLFKLLNESRSFLPRAMFQSSWMLERLPHVKKFVPSANHRGSVIIRKARQKKKNKTNTTYGSNVSFSFLRRCFSGCVRVELHPSSSSRKEDVFYMAIRRASHRNSVYAAYMF